MRAPCISCGTHKIQPHLEQCTAAAGLKSRRGEGEGEAAAGAAKGSGSLVSSLSQGQGQGSAAGAGKGVDIVLGPAVPCADETSIFRALGLAFVPTTMRGDF